MAQRLTKKQVAPPTYWVEVTYARGATAKNEALRFAKALRLDPDCVEVCIHETGVSGCFAGWYRSGRRWFRKWA